MPPIKTIEQHQYQRKIYTVSELNRRCKQTLEREFSTIWMEAEISNLAMPASGHWYFSLKDANAQVRCAMFKGANRSCKIPPEEGMKVLIRARVSLFEPRGEFQLIVEYLEPSGAGELQRQYEQLKAQLDSEGLFDAAHKKLIKQSNPRIGIVTSATGAAIHDVISVIGRRYPLQKLVIYPCLVQGNQAASQIIHQIKLAEQRNEVDLLLLVRGGGSIEDLWCFNDEALARVIYGCQLPIVTGIGHEVDFTIADYVSDLRAPTPSAAAEKTTPDQAEMMQQLEAIDLWLIQTIKTKLQNNAQKVDWLSRQLQNPIDAINSRNQQLTFLKHRATSSVKETLSDYNQRLYQIRSRLLQRDPSNIIKAAIEQRKNLKHRLILANEKIITENEKRLKELANHLNNISPLATLGRGYSLTRDKKGNILNNTKDINEGDTIITSLKIGAIESKVTKTHKENLITKTPNTLTN